MGIRLVEPDLKDPRKAQHMFECEECGLPRTYLIHDRRRGIAMTDTGPGNKREPAAQM